MPRFHCPSALRSGDDIELPPGAARHVQVLRLQPGDGITLFQGRAGEGFSGGEFEATVLRMGRSDVAVRIGAHHAVEREPLRPVHLLAGITANERMDWLVEKAAELGAASITPLVAERSVLKLKGERAEKSWRTGRPWPCRPASSAHATACRRCMRPPTCKTGWRAARNSCRPARCGCCCRWAREPGRWARSWTPRPRMRPWSFYRAPKGPLSGRRGPGPRPGFRARHAGSTRSARGNRALGRAGGAHAGLNRPSHCRSLANTGAAKASLSLNSSW